MRSVSFRILLIARLLLIVAAITINVWLFLEMNSLLRGLYFSIIPLFLIIEIFRFIEKNNRMLRNFLAALQWDDFSVRMPENVSSGSVRELNHSLNMLNEKMLQFRKDNYTQLYFIEELVKRARVGLLVTGNDFMVSFVNQSFRQLCGCRNISAGMNMHKEYPETFAILKDVRQNENKTVAVKSDRLKQLLFQLTVFKIEEREYRLYSVQDIREEVNNTEIESWKKIIRILSHEILNSTSPVLSLSQSLSELLDDKEMDQGKLMERITTGLMVISERSEGLIKFTNAFSKLSKLPAPEMEIIESESFMENIALLFSKELEERGIELVILSSMKGESLFADKYQLEQVVINLIKNSMDALENRQQGKINISFYRYGEVQRIEVRDNGPGIPADRLDKVFLPFYTTREGGNGIGLAFSRQVMHMHKGNIFLESELGKGTRVILELHRKQEPETKPE